MIDTISKDLCVGCNACENICPTNCILMQKDNLGFKYPNVNYDECISCRKCLNVCPVLEDFELSNWTTPIVYAAWSLDEVNRFESTSGGVFFEIAQTLFDEGYYICGAQYNENKLVEHAIIKDKNDLFKLRQSKYLQSDLGLIYSQIKTFLKSGQKIVFVGAPCQVAGLLKFISYKTENLLTIDFICRGMNSPKAYEKYLQMLEAKYNSTVKKVWFKYKSKGWHNFGTRVDFNNGKTYIKSRYNDLYMRGYLEENLYMMPACFNCKFRDFPRVADITLADFWGIENMKRLDNDRGTSMLLANSDMGQDILIRLQNIFIEKTNLDIALHGNSALISSPKKNLQSEKFLCELDNITFDAAFKKYASITEIMRFRNTILRSKLFNLFYKYYKKIKNFLHFK